VSGINTFMTAEHRRCDEILANAEESVDKQDWEKTEHLTKEFVAQMERHFNMEEQVLFPAFEERTGIIDGPTVVMRQEHEQMRGLLMQLQWALEAQKDEDYLDTSETLLIMMQQHNMKEEGMLYPMSDEHLGHDADQIVSQMQEINA
jgi:hemerythrin-like domain-containing protein